VVLAAISHTTASLLTVCGLGVILVTALLIIVPYLRGKADLVTAWNLALLGCMSFIGVAFLEAADEPRSYFAKYVSFDFPDKDYRASIVRSLFFLLCLVVFHYVLPVGRKFAAKRFSFSPAWSGGMLGVVLTICIGTIATSYVSNVANIPVMREIFLNVGQKAAIFASVFAFYGWYRNRTSPAAMLIFLGVFLISGVYSIQVSSGRRLILCLAFGPIAVMYWTSWRHSRPAKVFGLCALALTFVVGVGLWYQTFRFFDKKGAAGERSFAKAFEAAQQVDVNGMLEQLQTWKYRLPQGCFAYGLIAKRLVDNGELEPSPFNSFRFLIGYPIPRRFWPEKPLAIGTIIVTDVLKIREPTNWGLGVAGQGYYEGDWFALVAYAAFFALLINLIDEPLMREPNNPFMFAMLASASLYIVAWPRGDIGNQSSEIIENFLFLWILQRLCGLLLGTKLGAYRFDFGSRFARQARQI
jgi:hypothetical protein